jgi:hypothetical protein
VVGIVTATLIRQTIYVFRSICKAIV